MTSTPEARLAAPLEQLSESELCPDHLLRGQEEAFARDIERLQARAGEFVRVDCPACGRRDAEPTLEKHTFTYVTCRSCATLYMDPRPSPAVMNDYYRDSENYRYWGKYIFPASEESRREKLHKPWLDRIVSYCERFGVPRGLLVEVGSGFGTFAEVALRSGRFRRVVAVEINPEMATACSARGLEVIAKGIEDVRDELDLVDVVAGFEVIEHVFEPRVLLQQCARLMKPGALLVLSCPNGQGFDISLLGATSLAIDPEHVNLFNPNAIQILLDSCGFDLIDATTPGRLDAEFVRTAVLDGKFDVSRDPFLRRVLIDEWDRLGWPFQQFLADNGLSSHMWLVARRR